MLVARRSLVVVVTIFGNSKIAFSNFSCMSQIKTAGLRMRQALETAAIVYVRRGI